MPLSPLTTASKTPRGTAALLAAFLASTAAIGFSAHAGINATGDVDPVYDGTSDPWFEFRHYVGRDAVGSLDIFNGSVVDSRFGGYIGYNAGSNGTVTITDAGSNWNNQRDLFVGYNGTGLLTIENGGSASVSNATWVGYGQGAGTLSFNNGTLHTGGLNAAADSLLGVGTINTHGIVGDVNLVFNAASGQQQQLILNTLPGQNITLNIDASQASGNDMGAGYAGTGSLTIQDGVQINNRIGYLGFKAGSNGSATVTGAGSQWNLSSIVYVGRDGNGTINVLNAGVASGSSAVLGLNAGSSGTATIDGGGSQWNLNHGLTVGHDGSATLSIQNGGVVNVAASTLFGSGAGTGEIQFNNGTLNTSALFASTSSLLGTGTVNTNAMISDLNLTFDSSNGLQQQFLLNALPGQNVTINMDAGVAANNSAMGAGYGGTGSLNIADGVQLGSVNGYLGYKAGSHGTANITGPGTRWDNSSALYVGRDGEGTLNLSNGAVAGNVDGYLGQNAGSTGTATIDGAGSQWNNSEDLFVGYNGTGNLNVLNAGVVTSNFGYIGFNAGASGTASISGSGSQWSTVDELYVGRNGNGTLNLQNAGRAVVLDGGQSVENNTYIGFSPGSTGTINVTGTGSELAIEDDRGEVYIGYEGTAVVTIENGGAVNTNWDSFIGYASGSTGNVTIDGADSKWTNKRDLFVGGNGTGTLNILNGGVFQNENSEFRSNTVHIGTYAGSTGTVTVDGPGSEWNQNNGINVGANGTGTLIIRNAGVVNLTEFTTGSSPTAGIATFIGSTGIVTVDGTGSQWNIDRHFSVGSRGHGTLDITNGGIVNSAQIASPGGTDPTASIGGDVGSSGTVTVDGVGSEWNNNYDLTVAGLYGSGTLNIQNDGLVNVRGTTRVDKITSFAYNTGTVNFSNGTLNTDGLLAPESTLLGTGTINTYSIVSDTDLTFNLANGNQQQIVLDTLPGQNVTINYDNNQSPWVTVNVFLGAGFVDTASMTIEEGVVITNRYGYLGYRGGANGTANVTGAGSHWNNVSDLYVGLSGQGTLNILNGGMVSSSEGFVGYEAGSTGTVNVDGPGTQWIMTDSLIVGFEGDGTVNVLNGGLIDNTGSYSYIGELGGMGTVNVDGIGSQWDARGVLNRRDSIGVLNVLNGGVVNSAESVQLGHHADSLGAATVDGIGSILNSDFIEIGRLSIGMLTIQNEGAVLVSSQLVLGDNATLHFGSATLAGPFMDVGTNAEFSGTLKLTVDPGFTATEFDRFELITYASHTGAFTQFDGLVLGGGLQFQPIYNLDGFEVIIVKTGDLNADSDVDQEDLDLLLGSWGSAVYAGGPGDWSNDGVIGIDDLTLTLRNWTGSTTPVINIPEPGSAALLAGLGALGLCRRRRAA